MKKVLISLLLCLILTNVEASAQIKFGIKGGINFTNLTFTGNEHYNIDNKTGFSVGPIIKLSLPFKGLGIDAAALYDCRNAIVSSPNLDGGTVYKSSIKQHQIAIPVNLRYDFNFSHIGLYMFAGPQIGFGINNDEIEMDYGDWNPEKSNFSVNVGIGTTLMNTVQIALEYNIVCNKNANIDINNNKVLYKGKMNALHVSLGYYF